MSPIKVSMDSEAKNVIVDLVVELFGPKWLIDELGTFELSKKQRIIEDAIESLVRRERPLDELSYMLLQIGEALGRLCQRFKVDIREAGWRYLYKQLRELLLV